MNYGSNMIKPSDVSRRVTQDTIFALISQDSDKMIPSAFCWSKPGQYPQ